MLDHLSRYYDGRKVWLDGVRLDDYGAPAGAVQVLVQTAALTDFQRP